MLYCRKIIDFSVKEMRKQEVKEMAATISDNAKKMIFQSDMAASLRRLGKTDYAVFEGEYNNGAVRAAFDIRMKTSFIKKAPLDLIKNDHMIFQKKGQVFFLLFEADKDHFDRVDDSVTVFEEEKKTRDYQYKIEFRHDSSIKPEKKKSALGGKAGERMDEINAILEEHGITEADASSPVAEYMKTWKLGHPDGE